MAGKLFQQMTEAGCSDEDIEELYQDLCFVFGDTTFDEQINDAILTRKCSYVVPVEQMVH